MSCVGETANTHHKEWLVKRIIWRMQAVAEGDLTKRARRRAAELANDAERRRQGERRRDGLVELPQSTFVRQCGLDLLLTPRRDLIRRTPVKERSLMAISTDPAVGRFSVDLELTNDADLVKAEEGTMPAGEVRRASLSETRLEEG